MRLSSSKFCKDCKNAIKSAIRAFRPAAAGLLFHSGPTGPEWNGLIAQLDGQRVPVGEALEAIQPESVQFLERYVAFAFAGETVTPEELAAFGHFAQQLEVPSSKAEPLRLRLERGMILSQVRAGTLPRTRPQDVYLELDEICHLDIAAQYIRVLAASLVHVPGRLLITDRKLRFLGHNAGWELSWNKVMTVRQTSASTLHLQASQTKGSGRYVVSDPEYIATVVETVARLSRRELLRPNDSLDTRQIPQHIKAAVWQRDGGKCRECGATSYLEFDHIIPHSKGGATSVLNLQLLCRSCNLKKGDRL